VHLEGRASSAAPLYEFVASIENSPLFANANLGAMSEEQGDGPYDRRFTLTFELQQ
jgi:Tfp pilus assembly protein PilN